MRIRDHLRQLTSESLIYGLPSVISRFVSIFLVPIYTRLFSPGDYGTIGLIDTTLSLITVLVIMGLDSASFRWFYDSEELSDRKNTISSWMWSQTAIAVLFGFLLMLTAPWFSQTLIRQPQASLSLMIAAATLPFRTVGNIAAIYFRILRKPWSAVFFAIGVTLATISLTLICVAGLRMGILGVYVANLIAQLLITISGVFILKDWISPVNFHWKRFVQMIAYSFPLIPASLAFWVVAVSDRYFVTFYQNTTEVGLYQIGASLAAIILIALNAFQSAWAPFAFSIINKPEAKQVYAMVAESFMLISCFMALGITLFAPEVLHILTTPAYYSAYNVVGILTLGYILMQLYQILGIGSAIAKNMAPVGAAITLAAGFNIALNFILIPSMGRMGAAISTLAAQAVVPAFVYWRAQKVYPIPYRVGFIAIIFITTAAIMTVGEQLSFLPTFQWLSAKVILMGVFLFLALAIEPVRASVRSQLHRIRTGF